MKFIIERAINLPEFNRERIETDDDGVITRIEHHSRVSRRWIKLSDQEMKDRIFNIKNEETSRRSH